MPTSHKNRIRSCPTASHEQCQDHGPTRCGSASLSAATMCSDCWIGSSMSVHKFSTRTTGVVKYIIP